MSQQQTDVEKQLKKEADDLEAIREIMKARNVDEDQAKEIWRKFMETVDKLRSGNLP